MQHFVQGGYFLKDIALFDSAFYNYTTDVANVSIPMLLNNDAINFDNPLQSMDPQIRMLLESVYESVEDGESPVHLHHSDDLPPISDQLCVMQPAYPSRSWPGPIRRCLLVASAPTTRT